ncbi:MAG TPA: bifunctional hydroxymethylpyrimidine kinase/phosphomethylpyrimidine kinase [Bryobacteraceae bacterium]|nr:bifunctional hydroxymethylpyrimidine kinase/phosphomethylpyrimidine kinase [Bryobacteraceae bacterium]
MGRAPVALTIAGSDPSGGAGIQADLKTFHQFGVYGAAAIACITVQNTVCVSRVEALDPELVEQQIRAIIDDIPPAAVKTGALVSAAVVAAVANVVRGREFPIVVDPVMISKHGAALLADDAREALGACLLPAATLVTPNIPEAAVLSHMEIATTADMRRAAAKIARDFQCGAVLIKGGHLESDKSVDVLYSNGDWREYTAERVSTRHTHGTGCAYSAAIAALLARGVALGEAVAIAKEWVREAIATNPGLGSGSGPVNHHAPVRLNR